MYFGIRIVLGRGKLYLYKIIEIFDTITEFDFDIVQDDTSCRYAQRK